MRTEFDAPAVRQKHITNQALDKHGRTPLCTSLDWVQEHTRPSVELDSKPFGRKNFVEAEIASRADDSIPSGPNVREIESFKSTEATGQPVTMEEVNTDQFVERHGGASPQLDEEQVQPMNVSLDQSATTGATKRRAETP